MRASWWEGTQYGMGAGPGLLDSGHEGISGRLGCASTFSALSTLRLSSGLAAWSQAPVTLSASEPGPDIVVARGNEATYATRHPSGPTAAPAHLQHKAYPVGSSVPLVLGVTVGAI